MVVDHWIVDVKSMNPNIYKKYTEMESDIRQQLWTLKVLVPDECVTIKVPVIPEYNDETSVDADIEEIKDIYDFPNVVKTYYKKL
jgi:pyruvate formate lyase activating enzyme